MKRILLLFFALTFSAASSPAAENVEYLIVTPLRYAGIFQRLADWKTQKGVPAKVVTIEEILELKHPGDSASRIRAFLKTAYKSWNVRWVLLGGDTQDKTGACVPARLVRSGFNNLSQDIPSDLYFGNLDGTWDGNENALFGELKDNCDLTPEVLVGRAPVDSPEEASTFVEKVLAYEKAPPSNWARKALLIGNNLDMETNGKEEVDIVAQQCFKGFSVKRLTEDGGKAAHRICDVMNSFSPHFVHVTAHGEPKGFKGRDFFSLDHADALKNAFPFIYVAMSCNTNSFDQDCLSEHLLANPHGGAVALWACSRYGWYTSNNEGYSPSILLVKDFLDLLFNDPLGLSNHIGEAAYRARLKYLDEANRTDGVMRWLAFGMNLMGDPEMPVWSAEPQRMAVKSVFENSLNQIRVKVTSNGKPVGNALACLQFYDEQSVRLTLSARNCIPVEHKLNIASSAPGLYVTGRTGANGEVALALRSTDDIIQARIERIARLACAMESLLDSMQTIRSNTRVFNKLTRDHHFLAALIERNQKELGSFFAMRIQARRFDEIEKSLDLLTGQIESAPAAAGQMRIILNSITSRMKFGLAEMQGDSSGVQRRILNKSLELNRKLLEAHPSDQKPSGRGRIKVTSSPSGAQVYLDNTPRGVTPCLIDHVPEGEHTIKLLAPGLEAASRHIRVRVSQTRIEDFQLAGGCSIRGRIFFPDGKPCSDAGVKIVIYERNGEQWDKQLLFSGQTDANGGYSAKGLPRKDVYVFIEREGFNKHAKCFLYSNEDQGFRRTYNHTLIPMTTIAGGNSSLAGATMYLFKRSKYKLTLLKTIQVPSNGEFSFSDIPVGTFRLTAWKPNCRLEFVDIENSRGKELKPRLRTPPITEISAHVCIDGHWEKHMMKKTDSGRYALSLSLKGNTEPYPLIFRHNPLQKSPDGGDSLAVCPSMPTMFVDGIGTCNSLAVEREGVVSITYDPGEKPVLGD